MQSFHDWFIVGVSSNMDTHELSLQLCDDYKTRSATLAFKGATRFIVESFIAQNIIYNTVVFDNPTSTEYQSARAKLEKAHPWGNNWPTKQKYLSNSKKCNPSKLAPRFNVRQILMLP
jgi:hypothetical protein